MTTMPQTYKGFSIPADPDVTDGPKMFSDYVDTGPIPRFASVAARDAAIPSPVVGMVCFTADATGEIMWRHNGTVWWTTEVQCSAGVTGSSMDIPGADSTYQMVVWPSTIINRFGTYNPATGLFTAPYAGYVECVGQVQFVFSGGASNSIAEFYWGGSTAMRFHQATFTHNGAYAAGKIVTNVAVGSTIGLRVYVSAGAFTKKIYAVSKMTIRYISA